MYARCDSARRQLAAASTRQQAAIPLIAAKGVSHVDGVSCVSIDENWWIIFELLSPVQDNYRREPDMDVETDSDSDRTPDSLALRLTLILYRQIFSSPYIMHMHGGLCFAQPAS